MTWEIPIVDRSLEDVIYAKANQNSVSNLKGALNISDLNRIESNTVYLHDKLYALGYRCDVISHDDWTVSDLFYLTDMDRIRQNIINLVGCYYDFNDSPTIVLGNYNLTVTDINDVEKVIFDINVILERMLQTFRYCGTFYAGE